MRYKEPSEIAELKKLNELLNVNWKLTPSYHDAKFIILTCGQTFEGHGRASETWELYWTLQLPHIKWYSKYTDGWRVGDGMWPMSFHGRTALDVIQKAIRFLEECPKPEERTRV